MAATQSKIPAANPVGRSAAQLQTDATLDLIAREKDKGNDFYRQKRYGEAVAAYSRALDVTYGGSAADSADTVALGAAKATLYCNRAMCHLQVRISQRLREQRTCLRSRSSRSMLLS